MGRDPRRLRRIGYGFASSSALRTDSSRCRQDLRDANKIVGGGGQHEEPFHQAASAMSRLAQAAEPELLLELLIVPFDTPAQLGGVNQSAELRSLL